MRQRKQQQSRQQQQRQVTTRDDTNDNGDDGREEDNPTRRRVETPRRQEEDTTVVTEMAIAERQERGVLQLRRRRRQRFVVASTTVLACLSTVTTSLSHIVFTTLPFVAQQLQLVSSYACWRQVERLQLKLQLPSRRLLPELPQDYLGVLQQHDSCYSTGQECHQCGGDYHNYSGKEFADTTCPEGTSS